MEQRLKHYFATYKDSNECFATADGFIFHKRTDASAHAVTLADKKVSAHTRAEVEAEKPKAEKPKVEKPKAEKTEPKTEGGEPDAGSKGAEEGNEGGKTEEGKKEDEPPVKTTAKKAMAKAKPEKK